MSGTASDMGRWVNDAERGETFVYGYDTPEDRPDSRAMAVAWNLQEAGLVSLVQKRDGERIAYIAQRTWRSREDADAAARALGQCSCGQPITRRNTSGKCHACYHRDYARAQRAAQRVD